jgi:hypothetical protein
MAGERFVVLTTIQAPTTAAQRFAAMSGWRFVVVADRKTPPWPQAAVGARGVWLGLDDKCDGDTCLAARLPFDHYARKNLGYMAAIRRGASWIADVDDDNLPLPGWGDRDSFSELPASIAVVGGARVVNVFRFFATGHVWPRGFPLDHVLAEDPLTVEERSGVRIGVWQGLVAGEPDVDAIFRLTRGESPLFVDRPPVALATGVYCPFNSQNTLWHEAAFPYLYLPVTVSFRFSDILRGYVAQRGMWALDLHLAFCGPTVRQDRNPHELLQDFVDEIPCYTQVGSVLALLDGLKLVGEPHADLTTIYSGLVAVGIVDEQELFALGAWLAELSASEMAHDR